MQRNTPSQNYSPKHDPAPLSSRRKKTTRILFASTALSFLLTPLAAQEVTTAMPGDATISASFQDTAPQLQRVVLTTGGVGYFELVGQSDENGMLTLQVPRHHIDDVLKSLIVFGNNGVLTHVEIEGEEHLRDLFRDLPLTESQLDSLPELLQALRGREITLEDGTRGQILSVTPEQSYNPNPAPTDSAQTTLSRHRLSILTPQGIQQIILEEAGNISFADAELTARLSRLLAQYSDQLASDLISVTIRLSTEELTEESNTQIGQNLRIGYVVAAPLWKASYRLTHEIGEDTAHLTGWGILENLSGLDWENVTLTLTSGNPVTFRQALYAPYFVERPQIPVTVFGRILPRPDSGRHRLGPMQGYMGNLPQERDGDLIGGGSPAPMSLGLADEEFAREQNQPFDEQNRFSGEAEYFANIASLSLAEQAGQIQQNIAISNQAGGRLHLTLPEPISVAAGDSVMVPLIDQNIPVEALAYFAPGTHATHPLSALNITNDTAHDLPPGILTLYEEQDGAHYFLGDAQINVVPQGAERMVKYAVSQNISLDLLNSYDSRIRSSAISDGVMVVSHIQRYTDTYYVINEGREDQDILIEYPDQGRDLVSHNTDALERNLDGMWLIPVEVSAGDSKDVEIVTENLSSQSINLVEINDYDLEYYITNQNISANVRAVLQELRIHQQELADAQNQLSLLEDELRNLYRDQNRLRDNLEVIPAEEELAREYLQRLAEQEERIVELHEQINQKQQDIQERENEAREFIRTIEVE